VLFVETETGGTNAEAGSLGATWTDATAATEDSALILYTSDTSNLAEKMRIHTNASGITTAGVGSLGTSTPWAGWSVEQGGDTVPTFVVSDAGTSTPFIIVDGAGRVGIGTTSIPSTSNLTYKFATDGTVSMMNITGGSAGDEDVCRNPTTGELTDANGTACIVSSIRFKENISPFDNALSTIKALNPVTFTYKPELDHSIIKGKTHFGLIAEEVEKILPEVVGYEDDGITPRTIEYDELVPMLIKGMQEQQVQIDELKERIKILENK